MSLSIPFVNLRAQHEEVRTEIENAIRDIIDRSSFIGGSYVSAFERDFAEYLGAKEVLAVANGTDALWLGLLAGGVKAGEAVITVPNTFIATVEAISRVGAFPLFIDIDLDTANMDVRALKAFLEESCDRQDNGMVIHKTTRKRVSAVMPVHLYGLPADMKTILELAREYDLVVVEDACQAHGAKVRIDGELKRTGTLGIAAGFSFYPGKNLGAMGDGGAVVTNDPEMAGKMRWLRDHGQSERYIHVTPDGWNSRLDSIQASILSVKLKKLDEWNARRRQAARQYREFLQGLPLVLPVEPDGVEHVYHLYVVRAPDREYLRKELSARGIGVGLHYPIPLHRQKAYQHLGLREGSFPNTELSSATIISLPMHPALTQSEIEQIVVACREVLPVTV